MKDNDSLTNKEWLTDVRDALQGQAKEIERLRAVLDECYSLSSQGDGELHELIYKISKQALGEGGVLEEEQDKGPEYHCPKCDYTGRNWYCNCA